MWPRSSSSYRSERSTSRSLVVFTGTNRSRPTPTRPGAVEHLDRCAHRRLDLDHRGRCRVLRVDRLRVADHRQVEDAVVGIERGRERSEVDPHVVGVEVAVAADVLERVEVVVGGLGGLAQHQPTVGATPGEVAALAVRRRAAGHLHDEGDAALGHPPRDARIGGGAEVVGVRAERVAVAALEQVGEQAASLGASGRGRRVPAGTTPAPGRPATAPASGRWPTASARGAAPCRGPARRRPARGRRRARPASRPGCGSCSSARAAAAHRARHERPAPGGRSRRGRTARPSPAAATWPGRGPSMWPGPR